MARLKLGVLISGRGSNLQALIDACANPDFPAEIALVLSNRADAYGLTRAIEAGMPTTVIDHRGHGSREAFEIVMDKALRDAGVEFVCMAGFMRLLTPWFVEQWRDRLINIHPSLLPAFKGLDTHARALEAGVRFTGCTVHFVRPEMDEGPIIVQSAVSIVEGDTPDTLAARVLSAEHVCYPLAVKLVAQGRATVVGGRVAVSGDTNAPPIVFNPPV